MRQRRQRRSLPSSTTNQRSAGPPGASVAVRQSGVPTEHSGSNACTDDRLPIESGAATGRGAATATLLWLSSMKGPEAATAASSWLSSSTEPEAATEALWTSWSHPRPEPSAASRSSRVSLSSNHFRPKRLSLSATRRTAEDCPAHRMPEGQASYPMSRSRSPRCLVRGFPVRLCPTPLQEAFQRPRHLLSLGSQRRRPRLPHPEQAPAPSRQPRGSPPARPPDTYAP